MRVKSTSLGKEFLPRPVPRGVLGRGPMTGKEKTAGPDRAGTWHPDRHNGLATITGP